MPRSVVVMLLAALVAPAPRTYTVPSFRDVTIKTRITRGLQTPMVTTLRLKGARQRTESQPDTARHLPPFTGHILQCDQQTGIFLFERSKTYRLIHWQEPKEKEKDKQAMPPVKPAEGPIVTVTFDSVDTGERRSMGSYEAHHVKTTISVEPAKDAITRPGKAIVDGWYLDLEGLDCRAPSPDPPTSAGGWHLTMGAAGHDHFVFKYGGTAARGLPVEETCKETAGDNAVVNKVELVEFSERPLDEALFEIPPDYAAAPPPGRGETRIPFGTDPQ